MKMYLFQAAFLFTTLWAIPILLPAQVKHTVTLERDSIQIREKQYEDGNPYTTLEYRDCYTDPEEGAPSLPYQCLQFIIPDEAARYTVEVTTRQEVEFNINNPLLPGQKSVSLSVYNTKSAFVPPDSALYSSSSRYPAQIAQIVNDGYFDGDKRIVTVRVSPMQYIAAENKIILNKNFSFIIRPDRNRMAAVHRITPVHATVTKSEEELKQELNFVENKQDIPAYGTTSTNYVQAASFIHLPEYLIVTTQKFAPALERLVFWKKLKGLSAGIVTMENILNNTSIKGDEISGIYDDAGKLREYLNYAYQYGTKYVFLVGENIPFRYGAGEDDSWLHWEENAKIPTDLYYSDLNGNWNVDKDQYYGEYKGDKIDYFPELYVGRITCKNIEEINNYLYKLFCYEKNPGLGNNDYLQKALATQSDEMQQSKIASRLFKAGMKNNFNTPYIIEEKPSSFNSNPTGAYGSDIINEINTHYGFIDLNNHGWDIGIQTLTIGTQRAGLSGIAYCDAYDKNLKNLIAEVNEPGNGLDCLTNVGYPFIAYSTCCTTMPYDKLSDIPYNFGEGFINIGKYGAVAHLGNTRSGWLTQHFSYKFAQNMDMNENRIGKSEAQSKTAITSPTWHYAALSHNLLGCPEFQMWSGIPSKLINADIQIIHTDGNLIVKNLKDSCNFNIAGLFSGEFYIKHRKNSKSGTFYNPPQNYILMVSGKKYLPYIAPIYLQNEKITGKYTLYDVPQVYIGNEVDKAKTSGHFKIKSGASLSIEYSDEVILESGFEMEAGAIFELNPRQE